ncbi:hypothetical protein AGMMS50293_26760 [Spirochaetia bacterium]|nr:hypothetical protein AGMMS50293_26760 [Spirochaetia bacterium]
MGARARIVLVLLCVIPLSGLCAQTNGADSPLAQRGDAAAAEQYLLWAEQAITDGRWSEALAALERAADFSAVSSDISYLLARARLHEHKSRGAVLEALARSIAVNRWGHYSLAHARLLEAEQFIVLRDYSGALVSLAGVPASADSAVLRLLALKGLAWGYGYTGGSLSVPAEFRRRMLETMDRYPRDPRPLRVFFEYARNRKPEASDQNDQNDQNLMELALRRLPFVLEYDPDLAWMAAPFIRDTAEGRRLVMAYRAGGLSGTAGLNNRGNFRPNPASIAAALNLGLIGDVDAAEELFAGPMDSSGSVAHNGELIVDKDLIVEVSDLIRGEEGRNLFAQKLHSFTGIISGDEDKDGHSESRAVYRQGVIREYSYDADQDGLFELQVTFDSGGTPESAEQLVLPETESGGPETAIQDEPRFWQRVPARDEDRSRALIRWERYPAVLRTELGGLAYIPRPGEFQFAPLRFIEIGGNENHAGLFYPMQEYIYPLLSRRSMVSFSLGIKRPSGEFEGAAEQIDLDRSIPIRATETLNGMTVSITEFERGLPVLQRLDLDLDSRMETQRRFRRPGPGWDDFLNYRDLLASSESDWNGDGLFETGELYLEDGSVVYSWDMDGDGVREYSETKSRE